MIHKLKHDRERSRSVVPFDANLPSQPNTCPLDISDGQHSPIRRLIKASGQSGRNFFFFSEERYSCVETLNETPFFANARALIGPGTE